MTKAIPSAVLLGLLAAACAPEGPPQSAPGAGGAAQAPAPGGQVAVPSRVITVHVSLVDPQGASPSPLAQDWLRELKAAFAARPQHFTNVETREEAEAAVRIESALPTPDSPDHAVMSGSLLIGQKATPFRLDYTGGPAVMAGRFANYFVGQVEAARAAAAAQSPAPSAPPSTLRPAN